MVPIKNWPHRAWILVLGMAWLLGASQSAAQWRIMPVGNSITAGVGSTSGVGYRNYLYDRLQGIDFTFVGPNGSAPYNGFFQAGLKIEDFYSGGYGTGTKDIAAAMEMYRPDIILLHVGTNNMNNDQPSPYSSNTGITLERTSSGKLAELLRYLSRWSNGSRGDFLKRIYVCKIIPRYVDGTLDAKVAEYNSEIDRMFFENAPGIVFSKITLVDMYNTLSVADLGDGVHPKDAGYSKMAAEFNRVVRGYINGDVSAPGTNTWLAAMPLDGQTAALQWQSVGDDGNSGTANLYELRYAAFELTAANFSQGILVSVPKPSTSGNRESATVTGLIPGLSYQFAIRTYDELNNRGPISFSPTVDMSDTSSNEYCDDFLTAGAPNWNLHPSLVVDLSRGELVNNSSVAGWDFVGTYKAARYNASARGVKTSIKWSTLADSPGINASGIAMMMDGPSYQASGYLIRVRSRIIYLNEIRFGSIITTDIKRYPFPSGIKDPGPGDELTVKYSPSATLGNLFNVYLNGNYIGDVYDAARSQGKASQLYSGTVQYGGLNNAIDQFCIEIPPLEPDAMVIAAGNNKHGKVTQRMAEPLAVKVTDANGVPVSDVQVQFNVISGQASLSTDSLDVLFNGNLWIEAETGDLNGPFVTGNSGLASSNEFIYVPKVAGNNNQGFSVYQIYIPKSGSYTVHIRALAPDSYQNSCYFTFGADTLLMSFPNLNKWEWSTYSKSFNLSKGFVQFTIKNRESGTQIDKILLTSNANYRPSGTGQTTQRFTNITDVTGSAYTFITFQQAAGEVVVQASAPAVPNGSPQTFNVFADALDPQSMTYASETVMTGVAGQPLEKSFAVQLKDLYNNNCIGVQVDFTVSSGDGKFSRQNSIRVSSNSEGIASARFTLGYSPQGSTITASLPDISGETPLTFQGIPGEGIPVAINVLSGNAQSDTVAQTLPQPIVVQVLDEKGLPVVKYPVPFEIIRNNGSLNGNGLTVIDSTDTYGKTRVNWTLGDTAGVDNNIVRIDVPLNGAPLYFKATALPGPPTQLYVFSGDSQQGYAGEAFASPLQAKLADRFDNGRSGLSVRFSVVNGNGTFSGQAPVTVTTDSAGIASVSYVAGRLQGLNQIKAEADAALGINPTIFASLMVQAPRANKLTLVSGVGQEGIVMTQLANAFKVKLTNPFTDAVAGVGVLFKATSGGGKFSGQDSVLVPSNSSGFAEALLTLGSLAGIDRQHILISVPNYPITPLEITATALAAAAESIEPASDVTFSEQAQAVVPLSVIIKDAHGNVKSGHKVAFAITKGNGSFSNGDTYAEVLSNGGGLATVQYRMGTNSSMENLIAVSSARLNSAQQLTGSPIIFSGNVIAGAPRQLAKVGGDNNQSAKVLSTLENPFTVQVRDIYGNPSQQSVIVNFNIISGGGRFGNETSIDRLSDASGQAFALLRVGSQAGVNNNIVRVSVRDHPEISPVDFKASTLSGDPDLMAFAGDSLWSGRVQSEYTAYVVVKDIAGNLIENQPVLFSISRGEGKIRSASTSAAQDTLTIRTNNLGVAAGFWTVGDRPDTNLLTVTAQYQNSPLRGSPRLFKAVTYALDPVTVIRTSAERDTGVIHQPLARALRLQVKDQLGNPVPDHPVTFTAMYPATVGQQGKLFVHGLADTSTSMVVKTGFDGVAAVHYLLSPLRGPNHVRATALFKGQALYGSPVDFYVEGLPSPAKRLLLITPSEVSGNAGSTLAVRVRTVNAQNQPVSGHPVQFSTADTLSWIESTGNKWITINTAADGEAMASWILGTAIGSNINTLQITAGALENSPIEIKASVTAGTPDAQKSTISATDSILADNLQSSQIAVVLRDRFANPVAGKQVVFSSSDQGLTFDQPSQYSDAQGRVSGRVRCNRAGQIRIAAQVTGNPGVEICCAVVTFLPGPPVRMSGYAGNGLTCNAGTVLKDSLAVLVTDLHQNPVAHVPVAFAISSGGGYLLESGLPTFATQSDSSGLAVCHLVVGNQAGVPTVVYATSSHTNLKGSQVVFATTVVNGVAAFVEKYDGDAQNGIAGAELAKPLLVRVLDSAYRPIAHASIRFTALENDGAIISTNPVTTDHYGMASARYRLGTRAGNPPQLVAANLNGSALTTNFVAYAQGKSPAKLELIGEDRLEGIAGKQLATPLQTKIVDEFGNGVTQVSVFFRLADQLGSGQQLVDSVKTDVNGIAALQPDLPTRSGEYIYLASSPALVGSDLAFHISVKPDVAYRLHKHANDYQSMTVGRQLMYPVAVRVTDQYGNPVPEVAMQFTTLNNSGSVLDPAVTTNDSGIAASRWVIAPTPKTNTLMAFKLGLYNSPVQFTAIGVLNNYPTFVDLPGPELRIEYNKTYMMAVKAQDADGDQLHYSLKMTPAVANATFDSSYSHVFTWKPNVRQKGIYKINLRVHDGRGGYDIDSLLVNVIGDSTPVFTSLFPTPGLIALTYPDQKLFTCAAIDYDNDPISFTWYVDGEAKGSGPRFEMKSTDYGKGSRFIWVVASDGVKSVQSPTWHALIDAIELATFAADADPYQGVRINWSTTHEVDNAGFDVLRGTQVNGPFTRINGEMIPSREDGRYAFVDTGAVAGERYFYLLEDISRDGLRTRHGPVQTLLHLPEQFILEQNYPNPFNPVTQIRFQIPRTDKVKLVVYNLVGQQVRTLVDDKLDAGYYEITWDGRNDLGQQAGTGVYYYRFSSRSFNGTKKMLLLK